MKENVVKDKSFAFAIRIVKMYKHLNEKKREFIMSKQLLRSGTAVGALVREAEHAESTADFIHKLATAQKEINESIYWIELLQATDFLTIKELFSINNNATELLKLSPALLKPQKQARERISGSLPYR